MGHNETREVTCPSCYGSGKKEGNYDKAIAKYSAAFRQGKNKGIALMKRAACYAKKGDKDQAKDDYTSAINEGGLSKNDIANA